MPNGLGSAVPLKSGMFLLLLAVAAAAFAHTRLPAVAYFVPSMVLIAIVADVATFAVLLRQLRINPRRSTATLAFAYAVCGMLSFAFLLVIRFVPNQPAFIEAGPQAASWIYSVWHVSFSLYAIAYASFRRRGEREHGDMRAILVWAGVLGVAVVAAVLVVAIPGARYLPELASGSDLSGWRTSGVGPAAFIICAAALVLVATLGPAKKLDGITRRAVCSNPPSSFHLPKTMA